MNYTLELSREEMSLLSRLVFVGIKGSRPITMAPDDGPAIETLWNKVVEASSR